MVAPTSIKSLLSDHVAFELECIDRLYLHGWVPGLQTTGAVAWFMREKLNCTWPSTAVIAPVGKRFVADIERFAAKSEVDLITFRKSDCKEEIAQRYLADFEGEEGVLFVGKAQEKVRVLRTEKRRNPDTGQAYPWLIKSSAMVNQFYFYGVDRDFGPFFIKFSSYFPYPVRICINGHEYLKRQLARRGIAFEPLDNGIASCADPRRAQRLADGLSAEKIERFVRKWFAKLPHPLPVEWRREGYLYELGILQAEFALTQVFTRPLHGRQFFEAVIRENLDLGRPDRVQLIFDRRVTRQTPGSFRTRVILQGVTPSLHIQYKRSKIKQYFKEGRALRTETVINDTYDFGIGRMLCNLPALREVGFKANRRLLSVQSLSHDSLQGSERFEAVTQPREVGEQRVPALRFGEPRVMALCAALCRLAVLTTGFRHRDFRPVIAELLGVPCEEYRSGKATYDLRRLRLHGLIARKAGTQLYFVTPEGLRTAALFSRIEARLLRPGMGGAGEADGHNPTRTTEARALSCFHEAMDGLLEEACLRA